MNRRNFFSFSSFCLSFLFTKVEAKGNYDKPWYLGHHGAFEFKKFAKNLYIMHGVNHKNDNDAQCFVNNPAFIESKKGIILIDSGASYRVGQAVLQQIARITSKPIIAIINTHHHSDHWFANGAIKEKYPSVKIYGHKNFITSAKEQYFTYANREENIYKAKKVVFPDTFVDAEDFIRIDNEIFHVQHLKHTHTNSDITLTHLNSNVIFLGDIALESTLAYFGKNGSILNNITLLETINNQRKYTLYIPGHGTSGTQEKVISPYLFYLSTIKKEVLKAYQEEKSIFELVECQEKIMNQFEWKDGFNFSLSFLQNHIEAVYIELEQLDY